MQQQPGLPAPPDLGEIRGPVELPDGGGATVWLVVAGVIVLACALAFLVHRLRRKAPPAAAPSPDRRALADLTAARDSGDDRAFADLCGQALRRYCEATSGLPATKLTARELAAAGGDGFTELAAILEAGDRIRFAPKVAEPGAREQLATRAEAWLLARIRDNGEDRAA